MIIIMCVLWVLVIIGVIIKVFSVLFLWFTVPRAIICIISAVALGGGQWWIFFGPLTIVGAICDIESYVKTIMYDESQKT